MLDTLQLSTHAQNNTALKINTSYFKLKQIFFLPSQLALKSKNSPEIGGNYLELKLNVENSGEQAKHTIKQNR